MTRPASLAPGNWTDPENRENGARRTKIKMRKRGILLLQNFYRFAYSVVVQKIARLESLNDLSEMDGLIMQLEYLNRTLTKLDSPDTDEFMLLIGEVFGCMSRDRSVSLGSDGVNVPHRVSNQRHGRPSFEIKQVQL